MTATHLMAIWQAESIKLLSRLAVRFALVLSVLIGIIAPLTLFLLGKSDMVINGTPLAESLTRTAPMGAQWALELRNFFLFRVLLIMVGALAFAGEFQSRTLREDLLRPVPRWAVIFGKWTALVTFVTLCAGITWLVASGLGLVLFGFSGSWGPPALGYLATALTDAGFAALVLAIAVVLRSVAATIAGVVLFMVFDTFLGWALTLLGLIAQFADLPWVLTVAVEARPWLPSAAFGAWTGFTARADWVWQSFLALGILTALCLLLAERFFARTDVP